MLIGPPVGEARQIVEHFARIGVKDVRTIAVDQDARRILLVIGVTRDMRTAIDDQHPLAPIRGEALGHYRPCEARPDHNAVVARAGRHNRVDRRQHRRGGVIPRRRGEHHIGFIPPAEIGAPRECERVVTSLDEDAARRCNADPRHAAVMPHHIDDRGRHDGTARSEIFGRLGRADEAGRLIDRKRHQRDIPAGDHLRQLVIGTRSQIGQVIALGQVGRVDLDHRTDDLDRPVGSRVRKRAEQVEIHPLVDHAIKAEPRLPRARPRAAARAREMRNIDAGGKGMHVPVTSPPRFVETIAAGEHDIGSGE